MGRNICSLFILILLSVYSYAGKFVVTDSSQIKPVRKIQPVLAPDTNIRPNPIPAHPFRHHIISVNIADYILQKYNVAYEYLPENEKWRVRVPVFFDVKDQNYGIAINAYSNWLISKHVTHLIGGSLQGEYIGSFYQDFYLKFRPRGYAIDPDFATGMVFTAADRFVFGIDAAIGPGMVFRDNRFKGVYLDLRLGLSIGVKF